MKRKTVRRRAIRPAPRPRAVVALVVEEARWRKDAVALRLIRRAAKLALAKRAAGGENSTVTILLADDARLKMLNARFRKRNKATNVLSFAGASPGHLGDIAIAYETVKKQARAQAKSFAAHAAHLAVHGILHLLGYDHERARDASAMETLEISLLAELGLTDPYAPKSLTSAGKAA